MANEQHVVLLKQGADVWNTWKKQHPDAIPDLSGANLAGLSLQGVQLAEAYLQGANLNGTNLQDANLQGGNLDGADIREANFAYANLRHAYLFNTDHSQACFIGANLDEAKGIRLPIEYLEEMDTLNA